MDDASFEEELEAGARLVRQLAQGLPTVGDLLQEHEDDNDEILPTIFLSQVADWYVEAWRSRQTELNAFEEAERFTARLAASYPQVGAAEQNMIAVGFLEALPNPGAAERACVDSLPDVLREEREKMDTPRSDT
ncbi:hypothetical protein HUO13_33315 [Saccharopolyspora erythraea]|uniref:hypothetical protein n=1 Tax=Saccharopolyspora erythraea TaxID=1836 RepID=UPI001BAA69AC|nr:hypothetical protein [Saccharopolyspora erythraea]QUH05013.1 hypothetical protein HUO13_33315 [Saccharopolyspora erythraea]